MLRTPELEDDQRPQHLAMITNAPDVLTHKLLNFLGVEESPRPKAIRLQNTPENVGQRSAKPLAKRYPERLLAPSEDLRGQPVRKRALEELLQSA